MLNEWHGRIMRFPLGLIMWATILRLFNCLASLDGSLVTNSLFPQTCLSTISLLCVAWAVDSFSRGEGKNVKHTFMGWLGGLWHILHTLLKLVPLFCSFTCATHLCELSWVPGVLSVCFLERLSGFPVPKFQFQNAGARTYAWHVFHDFQTDPPVTLRFSIY